MRRSVLSSIGCLVVMLAVAPQAGFTDAGVVSGTIDLNSGAISDSEHPAEVGRDNSGTSLEAIKRLFSDDKV